MGDASIRILLVEADPAHHQATVALLGQIDGWSPALTWRRTYHEGIQALRAAPFDVVLLDYRLGDRTGIDFLSDPAVRASGTPVILLTAHDREADLAAAAAGAADFLDKKEVTARSLERAVRYAVESHRRRRAERRVHALVEHARDLILVTDAQGAIRYTVGDTRVLLHSRDEGVVGCSLFELIDEAGEAPGLERTLERARAQPATPVDGLARVRAPDGGIRHVEYTMKSLLDDPAVQGVVVTARDVTERVERERRIGFQAELLDRVGHTVFVVDDQQRVTYWNRAAAETLGWRWEDVRGRSFVDKVAPGALPAAERIWQESGVRTLWEGELNFLHKDGSEVTLLLTVVPTRGLGGSGDGRIAAGVDVTELRRAQRQLDEHRALLGTVVANAPIILFALDGQGRFTLSEGKGLAGLGLEPGAVVGTSALELYEGRPAVQEDIRRALAGHSFRGVREVEGRVLEIWWSPLSESAGAIGVAVDVTQQQQAEREQKRLLAMLDATPDFVGIATVGRQVMHVNPAGRRMAGIGPDEDLSSRTISDFHPPWAWALLRDEGLPTAVREGSWTGDSAIRTEGGGEIPVRQMLLAHRGESGEVEFFSTVASDLTERQRAAERIRFQASLLDAVGQAVLASELDGTVTYWNRAAEELLGWTADEAVGRNVADLVPARYRGQAEDIMRALVRGERWSGEFVLRRRDGREFPALVTNAPILDEEGVPVGVVGVSSDLTKIKELETELRQVQKLEAVGRLAGGVAHDFNNLLTAIRGHVELLLLEMDATSELWADLSEVQNAAKRASDLTRQLLAFGRKQMLEERVLDLRQEVAEMQGMLRRLVPQSIGLDIESAADPVLVRADPTQVHQVLVNLVVNAADAMPKGGSMSVSVDHAELTADQVAEIPWTATPGRFGRLTVRDDGTGMTPEIMDRMFEPFYTTKPVGEGTGLGLSTVFGIVKQSKGHLIVDSEPGHGSVFQVLLPAVPGPGPEPDEAEVAPARFEGGTETILVAEDDDVVRRLTTRLLTQAGYRVLTASTGAEALAMALDGREPIHLVLSDVVMPELGGSELARTLHERAPGLPVVLMSGYPRDELPLGPGEIGVGFLGKPFTLDELTQAVREALEGR